MAKKAAASKGKEKEKAAEKPQDTKKKEPAPPPAPSSVSVPSAQPTSNHVVRELVTVQEEPEDEIEKMDILQSRGASDSGWGHGGGEDTGGGDGGGWGGGGGWGQDQYDGGQSGRNSQMDDGWDENHEAPNDQWESPGQHMHSPVQMSAAAPGSPPPLPTPPPVSFPHAELGATKVTKHSENPGTEFGVNQSAGQQQFGGQQHFGGQFQSQLSSQPLHDDSGRTLVNETAAPAMAHRTAHAGISSTGGAKARSSGHDPRGANPKGGPYWGPPTGQPDPASHTQKTAPRSALKAAGGTSLAKANTPWGQPKNTDPWGELKASLPPDPRHQYPVSDHSAARGGTKAWETWGKPAGWTKPTYGDDDNESSDETVDGWGTASAWDTNQRGDEWGWQMGAKKSKVTFAPSGSGGTQHVLSPQQHSQILSSLLNSPNQSHTTNTKPNHHGHQAMPHPQHHKQMQQHHPQHHPQNHPTKHKHEQTNQHPFSQHYQQQQHQHPEHFQDHGQGGKKNKKSKQKQKQKQTDTWGNDGWADGENVNGWEVGDNSWGNDGWDEQGDGWGDATGGKDGWGDNNGGSGRGGESHDGWGTGGGNDGWGTGGGNDGWGTGGGKDDWGQAGSSKDAWGAEGGKQDQWGQGGGAKKGNGKGKGKGKGKTSWDAVEEEEDSDADDWGVPHNPSKSQKSVWGSVQAETPYTMPSKTLAHAYRGTTASLSSSVVDRNKIREYTDIQFIESKGAALHPVQNALFGRKLRMARDRIHWLFSPDKDERVSSLLAWIQAMEYNLGAFGLDKFLQTRERGALFANANYRPEKNPNQPAFDWITFDDLQQTRDKTIQESVVSYNPALQVVVFVFLPSKTGNSIAMWRRKINVPNNMRLMLQNEIKLALAGLRKQEAYEVHVDELPVHKKPAPRTTLTRHQRHRSLPAPGTNQPEKKKKRKWWQFLRFET